MYQINAVLLGAIELSFSTIGHLWPNELFHIEYLFGFYYNIYLLFSKPQSNKNDEVDGSQWELAVPHCYGVYLGLCINKINV